MQQPLQIQYLDIEPSPALDAAVRERVDKLERFCPDIFSCRVAIEQVARHQHQGRRFAVRVDLSIPEHRLAVDRVLHEDVYVALREAFDDMRRQVEDAVRRRRGQEKLHPVPLHGEVVRFADEERAGFIRAADGDEYYFSAENLAGVPFENLEVGTPVQFLPELGMQGRQAKRVSVGKHGAG